MNNLDKEFWEGRYGQKETGWDIGYPSTPLCDYFDQLSDKSLRILIPGCGNAYEASYLYRNGFDNVFLLDIAEAPLKNFKTIEPDFPENQLIQKDFFEYTGNFDLIIEQTFFCALPPKKRHEYASHMNRLLNDKGKLTGLLFNTSFDFQGPPFGGERQEYLKLFSPLFKIKILENCYNSIPPRMGKELFFIFEKND